MPRAQLCAAIAAVLALAVPAPAGAASRWFLELEGAPAADGTSQAALDAEHRRFASSAKAAGIDYRERFAYRTLFNGLSITADDEAVADLDALDGVAAVYPVGTMTTQQTSPAFEPSLAFSLSMIGVDIAQSRLGLTGRGVHVAVVDSGIDYDHPDLGGCFGQGCRVTNGYDFVGDDYDEEETDLTWQPVPHPDPFPDDCNGHGTHVAGIIGANGSLKGVAPDVTFGAYRVIGCDGGVAADVDAGGVRTRLPRRRRRAQPEPRRTAQHVAGQPGRARRLAPGREGHRRRVGGRQRPLSRTLQRDLAGRGGAGHRRRVGR